MSSQARFAALALASAVIVAAPTASMVRGASRPGLPPAKQALADAHARAKAEALTKPQPAKNPWAPPPLRGTEPAWKTGIVESGQAPFPGSVYAFTNQWHAIVDGQHANVYAGALREDPAQGIVALEFTTLDVTSRARAGGIYLTPSRAGAVRIAAATGTILRLEAATGVTFTFDVVEHAFR